MPDHVVNHPLTSNQVAMRYLLGLVSLVLLTIPTQAQKRSPRSYSPKVVHILTPFNGMHAGFNPDGSQRMYVAQIATMKGITDFASTNGASHPSYKFGYFELVYDQVPNQHPIQTSFSLPPNQDFTITLTVTTSVNNSSFAFTLDTFTQTKSAKNGINVPVCATFKGSPSGQYALVIDPVYQMDGTKFLLTQMKIESN